MTARGLVTGLAGLAVFGVAIGLIATGIAVLFGLPSYAPVGFTLACIIVIIVTWIVAERAGWTQ